MPEIKIKVGAAVDQSMRTVFRPLVEAAKEARKQIAKEFGLIGVGMSGGFATGTKSAKKEFTTVAKAGGDLSRELARQSSERTRLAKRESEDEWRTYAQAARKAYSEASADARKSARESTAAAKESQAAIQRFAERTSHRATRFFMPNMPIMSMARRAGSEVLQGLGVDASISGSVSRGVGVESLATQLSNQGYRKGEAGPAGTRVDGSTLQSEARSVAGDLKLDPAELLKAQTKFVDITGNLDESRKNMKGLAEIAAATGTDFTAMAEAAGNISRHLEEGPDKAQKLQAIMRVMAGQGKVGSIEIKDFAMQMAKIAALAPKYGGDTSANITKLTTLAQLSRAEGGSATAAQAATSVARFTDTFSSGARMKKFNAMGIATYEKNVVGGKQINSKLADPFLIIKQSLEKTKGDALVMADLFKSVMSKRAVDALTAAFNGAGGGKKGQAAVDAQLKIFGKESAITPEEVQENNAKREATKAAKAQDFQNKLDIIVDKAVTKLIPALDALAEPALKLAGALGDMASWAADSPWEAVAAAAAIALGRAIAESSIRSVIETAITAAAGNMGIGGAIAKTAAASEAEAGLVALEGAGAAAGASLLALAGVVGVVGGAIYALNALNEHSDLNNPKGPAKDEKPKITAALQDNRPVKSMADLYAPNTDKNDVTVKNHNVKADEWRSMFNDASGKPGGGGAGGGMGELKTQMAGVHSAIKDLHASIKGGIPVMMLNQDQPKAPHAGAKT